MYISIVLPPGVGVTAGAARVLAACALRHGGALACSGVVCEVFPAPRGTLILARCALSARVADYARPILYKYFTD